MSSFKKLSKSDVTVVPYGANKYWTFTRSTSTTYSSINQGTNVSGSFFKNSDPVNNSQYERLVYNTINQLFYQSITSSLNTSSLANSIYYESASQQRPTSSYFIYNDSDNFVNNFPTNIAQTIQVLAVNADVYGSKVLPNSILITGTSINIIDDGFGNLYNTYSTKTHVGNIFYAQGMFVITNQSYQSLFINTFTISFRNEHIIYENEVRCLIKESDFNLSYNPTLLMSGSQYIVTSGSQASGSAYTLTGSIDSTIKNFATGSILSSGSYFRPYTTQLGLYNDNNELLAVAKFGKPIMMSPDTDMTFVVKYDT